MKITILTLFPEMFDGFLTNSIIKRAISKNVVEVKVVNIRDYTKDKYGRNIVDPKRGVVVAFETFGDSSIDIALKQYVLVEERYVYEARVKELVYNTLNENGIEIPFPQRDVHIISTGQ